MVSLVKPITTKITDIKRLFYVQIFWYRNRKFLLKTWYDPNTGCSLFGYEITLFFSLKMLTNDYSASNIQRKYFFETDPFLEKNGSGL